MKKNIIAILVCGAVAFSGLWHSASAEDKGVKDAQKLFESRCSLCHSIDRPGSKKKTREEWEATVMRMKNVNGAPVTDEEAKVIIDYLAEKYGK